MSYLIIVHAMNCHLLFILVFLVTGNHKRERVCSWDLENVNFISWKSLHLEVVFMLLYLSQR